MFFSQFLKYFSLSVHFSKKNMQQEGDELIRMFGFPPDLTDAQLRQHFSQFTSGVDYVQTFASFDKSMQIVEIHCTSHDATIRLIDGINYTKYGNSRIYGYVDNEVSRTARNKNDTSILIYYDAGHDVPSHRGLYNIMRQHGEVFKVKIYFTEKVALVSFFTKEDAESAFNSSRNSGYTVKFVENVKPLRIQIQEIQSSYFKL